jgi:sugar lactone lactonase YvrE
MYIRRDALASLWNHGLDAFSSGTLVDPYEGNELVLVPDLVINESGSAAAAEGALSGPRNVEVGPDGRLFVADSGNHRIQVFDAGGQFSHGWGSFGAEPGQLNEPWGLAIGDEFVYVADTWNHRIQKFTLDGELAGTFGASGSPSATEVDGGLGLFFGPRDVLLLDDGRLLVTDTGNHRLQLLDTNGEFIRVVGGFGNGLGQFNEPVGLAQGPDGSIYVADTWNGRIQRFSMPDLIPVSEWRVDAWDGQSINNKPYLAVDSGGRVYTTDPEGYRVLIFSSSGGYLNRLGQFGALTSNFGLPNGLAIDGADNLYVADSVNNRILRYASIYGPVQ